MLHTSDIRREGDRKASTEKLAESKPHDIVGFEKDLRVFQRLKFFSAQESVIVKNLHIWGNNHVSLSVILFSVMLD